MAASVIQHYEAPSWDEARSILRTLALSEHRVYFRGQSNATWPLQSRLARIVEKLAVKSKWAVDQRIQHAEMLEERLLGAFKRACNRLVDLPPTFASEKNEDELLAFAQHYGVPTRLLDWTTSPYIAAFFAFDGCREDVFPDGQSVSVWALDRDLLHLLLYNAYHNKKVECLSETVKQEVEATLDGIRNSGWGRIDPIEIAGNRNRRMVYQEGLFTRVVKVQDDIEEYLRQKQAFSPGVVLTKITVPGNQQATALKDLALMAITPVVLMNDCVGAAATAFNEITRFTSS